MTDANKRPNTTPDQRPEKQTGTNHGSIKGPQRTGHNTKVTDTQRGSEVETRNSSNNRG